MRPPQFFGICLVTLCLLIAFPAWAAYRSSAVQRRMVARSIQPETVHIRSLAGEGRLRVLEQNYKYDLLNPQKLLESERKHQDVEGSKQFIGEDQIDHTQRDERRKGEGRVRHPRALVLTQRLRVRP